MDQRLEQLRAEAERWIGGKTPSSGVYLGRRGGRDWVIPSWPDWLPKAKH
jgi:hypothetical protein